MWRGGGGEGVCGEAANFQSRNLSVLILGFWRGLKCFILFFKEMGVLLALEIFCRNECVLSRVTMRCDARPTTSTM